MNIEGLRICTACRIHHYENCGTCFGFGMYPGRDGSLVPISAGAAHSGEFPGNWATCPECDSGPAGVPKGKTKTVPAKFMADTDCGPIFEATCPDCEHRMRFMEDWPEECNCAKWVVRLTATRVEATKNE